MNRYCIDTSAYSWFKRGDAHVTDHIDGADWIGVPVIVLGELWTGFLLGGRLDRNEQELREFLANPVAEPLFVDDEVAHIYGEIVAALRRRGTPLPTNDIWIAATAARCGAPVLTFDPHFRAIERIGCVVLVAAS